MNTAHATYHDGQLTLDEPVDWPSGTRAVVVPETSEQNCDSSESDFNLSDDDRPSTPEEIAELLAWFDSRDPLCFTPEEQAEWEASRQRDKAIQIELTRKNWEELDRMFP